MADPKRPGRLPEGSRTLPIGTKVEMTERTPRITPPRGTLPRDTINTSDLRTTAPFVAQPPKPEVKAEPNAEPQKSEDELTRNLEKFVDPADPRLRTNVLAPRTIKDVPARDPRDRLLPEAPPVEVAAPHPAVEAAPPAQKIEKTKIWVATHNPPVDPDPRLILLREPDSPRAASFRVLRHRLQQQGDPRTIVVTSAGDGEGKSTCAANLAMALGECERAKVLLLEANLRNPTLAALFGFLPPSCFAVQLQQHKDKPLDPWSVVEAFSPSLHVMAVKPGQESRPLLDGPALAHAMDMLKNAGYDYIVVDTPPVLGSADVNLVEDLCDGVLLCGWSGKSSGRALRRAVEQLAPAKILGLTLLDV